MRSSRRCRACRSTSSGRAPSGVPSSPAALADHLSDLGEPQSVLEVHTAARTQTQWDPRAKDYMDGKRAEGKTRAEALRCLKRRASDVLCRTMTNVAESTACPPPA